MGRRRYDDYEYERDGYGGGRGGYSRGGGRRRYGYSRRDRKTEERRTEMITFISVIILLVAMYMNYSNPTHLSPRWVTVIAGTILVGSGLYQSSRRWRVNPMTWVGGAVMLTIGIMSLQPGGSTASMPLGIYFPFLVIGGVLLASFVTGEL